MGARRARPRRIVRSALAGPRPRHLGVRAPGPSARRRFGSGAACDPPRRRARSGTGRAAFSGLAPVGGACRPGSVFCRGPPESFQPWRQGAAMPVTVTRGASTAGSGLVHFPCDVGVATRAALQDIRKSGPPPRLAWVEADLAGGRLLELVPVRTTWYSRPPWAGAPTTVTPGSVGRLGWPRCRPRLRGGLRADDRGPGGGGGRRLDPAGPGAPITEPAPRAARRFRPARAPARAGSRRSSWSEGRTAWP